MAAVLALGLSIRARCQPDGSDTWPTLHRDNVRSGHTSQRLAGPLERKWFRSFVEEMIGPRCEAIIADGLCFVGTYSGNLYALDCRDGSTAWRFAADGPIGHSPCYAEGKIFFAADSGFEHGSVYCLSAKDGKPAWRYTAAAGFWTSPATDGERIYLGDRSGVFHCIDAATGKAAWTFRAGAMILKPASIAAAPADGDARIVFAAEDMHVYCLTATGRLVWKSPKLAGLSLRDAAPTLWAGKVVVRTNPPRPFHMSLHEGLRLVCGIQRALPLDPDEDKVFPGITTNQYFLRRTDRRERAENEGVRRYLAENPQSRTWFTFGLDDGREPWIAPVMYTAGLHNPPSPPCFHPTTGDLYTFHPTALGVYCDGVSQVGVGIGKVDPKTGYVTNISHAEGDRVPGYYAGMTMIADETSALSLMDQFLVSTHQGAVGGVDLVTRKLRTLHGQRDSYGGLFGPGIAKGSWEGSRKLEAEGFVQNLVNEWHGPDRSIVAIAGGRAFWIVGSCVVAFGGNDVPRAATGGDKPPAPWTWTNPRRIRGGNVTASLGQPGKGEVKPVLDATAVLAYAADPEPQPDSRRTATSPLRVELVRRLDGAVGELLDGHPWAPWIVQLGISQEEVHFGRSALSMQVVARALPHLTPATREKAVAWLDKMYDEGAPLRTPQLKTAGARRELHDLPDDVVKSGLGRIPQHPGALGDLHAVWAYAHYGSRWDRVTQDAGALLKTSLGPAGAPEESTAVDSEGLNDRIAGLIAHIRLSRRLGGSPPGPAIEALVTAANRRIHIEQHDPQLQARQGHQASLPRYLNLTPEIGRMLADHAGEALARNLADLDRELPVWHQAWGERLIGGENYISPPGLSRAVFTAMAYGGHLTPERVIRRLDQPWCRADLYYIEKLTAALEASARWEERSPR